MKAHPLLPQFSFEEAALECVGEHGIDDLRLEHFGTRLGYSRATMYRVYGNRRGLMTLLHEEVMERMNNEICFSPGDPRGEFERWWEHLLAVLRSHQGRLFLRLRPAVAPDEGVEALVRIEVRELRHLREWLGRCFAAADAQFVAELAWTLLLSAGATEDASAAARLRELAWSAFVAAAPKESAVDTSPP